MLRFLVEQASARVRARIEVGVNVSSFGRNTEKIAQLLGLALWQARILADFEHTQEVDLMQPIHALELRVGSQAHVAAHEAGALPSF